MPSPGFLLPCPLYPFQLPTGTLGGSSGRQDTHPGQEELCACLLRSKRPSCRLSWGFRSSTHCTRTQWCRRFPPGEAQERTNGMLQDAVHVAVLLPPFGAHLATVNYERATKRRVSSPSSPAGMEAELGSWVQRGVADEGRRAIPCVAGGILSKAMQAGSSGWACTRHQKNTRLTPQL